MKTQSPNESAAPLVTRSLTASAALHTASGRTPVSRRAIERGYKPSDRPADHRADACRHRHRERAPEADPERRSDDRRAARPGADRAERDEEDQCGGGHDDDDTAGPARKAASVGSAAPTEKEIAEAQAA